MPPRFLPLTTIKQVLGSAGSVMTSPSGNWAKLQAVLKSSEQGGVVKTPRIPSPSQPLEPLSKKVHRPSQSTPRPIERRSKTKGAGRPKGARSATSGDRFQDKEKTAVAKFEQEQAALKVEQDQDNQLAVAQDAALRLQMRIAERAVTGQRTSSARGSSTAAERRAESWEDLPIFPSPSQEASPKPTVAAKVVSAIRSTVQSKPAEPVTDHATKTVKGPVRNAAAPASASRKRKRIGSIADYLSREGLATAQEDETKQAPETSSKDSRSFEVQREYVRLIAAPISDDHEKNKLIAELRDMMTGKLETGGEKASAGNIVAIDSESVGGGESGRIDILARVSVVNFHGHVLYDTFVKPQGRVTDWRTRYSGVRPSDVEGAPEFEEVRGMICGLLDGRKVVGHAVHNDFRPLKLQHPAALTRDTLKIKGLCAKMERPLKSGPSLKKAIEAELGVEIQHKHHSSVVDARASMALYRLWKREIDQEMQPLMAKFAASPQSTIRIEDADILPGGLVKPSASLKDINKGTKWARAFPLKQPNTSISSGLGKVIYKNGKRLEPQRRGPPPASQTGEKWWQET